MKTKEEQRTIDDIFQEILEIEITENFKMLDLKTMEIVNKIEEKIINESDATIVKYLEVKRAGLIHTLHKEVNWVAHPERKISRQEFKRRFKLAKSRLSIDLLGLFSEK